MRKTNKEPIISVIMPVLNGELFLKESIESILNQTFKYFELIVINDNSVDNTLEITKNFIKKDNRIVLINNKINLGRSKSRNKGLKIAKGKYIAILDADDVSTKKRLEKQYNFLEKNKFYFLVGANAHYVDENGKLILKTKQICNERKLLKRLMLKNAIIHSTTMFRNQKGLKYREKFVYSQDYDFYLYLVSKGFRLTNIKDYVLKYRIKRKSALVDTIAKQKLFSIKANKFYHERLKFGKDSYRKFNPNRILLINVEKSKNKVVMESVIKASFILDDFQRTKKVCKNYFKFHGFSKKILIYYIFSFFGKNFKNKIAKYSPMSALRYMNK